ncbi:MAG: SEC-C metal-binding domain-containing protein, partial [Planctomycetota bacterium]
TEEGIERAEKLVGVDSFYTPANMSWPHHLEQSLKAHNLFSRDVDYVVKEGEIIIVDEFTGRLMEGRRWSDGLHQAVEAKERIKIKEENQTLATITFQNFFRLYDKLAGMTGTALTEAAEFSSIYKLDVLAIPTNKPLHRESHSDVVYRTVGEKYRAIVDRIEEIHATGRPLLVGTIAIETSELLSKMLKRRNIPHNVLNAKYHEREAEIITQAGQEGWVTIATNMAGRGTDIVLGDGVAGLGGLFVLGSERHEARRIDNQLRGRCGRQGDPGTSQFFLSLEDDLMRVFASERVSSILKRFGMDEGVDITHPMVTRAIERAQKKVEARNFEIRKQLLEYDEVMDHQRKLIYGLRNRILHGKNLTELVKEHMTEVVTEHVSGLLGEDPEEGQGIDEICSWCRDRYGLVIGRERIESLPPEEMVQLISQEYSKVMDGKRSDAGAEGFDWWLHIILLQGIDNKWKDHLHAMDQLRAGIGLRGYAQVDPKVEYKREGYRMFRQMLTSLKEDTTALIPRIRVQVETDEAERSLASTWSGATLSGGEMDEQFQQHGQRMEQGIRGSMTKKRIEPIRNVTEKVGRNDPCTCGSGKKYKKCCGKIS